MRNSASIVSSFAWKLAERMLAQGIGVVIQIVIARMVKPEAIGEMAILLSVVNVFSVVAQSGFSSYIIQKKDLQADTLSTVTTFSMMISFICIFFFIIFGDILMRVVKYPHLGVYLKVLGWILLFNAINGICTAILAREMKFKEMFLRTLVVLPISLLICFVLIGYGLDLEALITYNIVNPAITSVFLLILLKKNGYRFKFKLKYSRLREALPYSMRVLLQDIGNVMCNSLRSFSLGMFYSSNVLAYYDRAYTYTGYVEESITYATSGVLLPAMAKEQDNKTKFKYYIENSIALYSMVIVPALVGFAAIAPTFTKLILGEKWLPCVPYMYIFSVGFLHYPILTIQKPAFLACGRSDITLKITIIQNCIALFVLLLTINVSSLCVAVGTSLSLLSYIPLYVVATKKHLKISIKDQVGSMIKYILISLIMVPWVSLLNRIAINDILKMVLQIFGGIGIYVFFLIATRDRMFYQTKAAFFMRVRGGRIHE